MCTTGKVSVNTIPGKSTVYNMLSSYHLVDKSSFQSTSIYIGIDLDSVKTFDFCWLWLFFASDEVSLSHTVRAAVRCPRQTSRLRPSNMCGSTPHSLRKCWTRSCCTWWKTAGERGGIEILRESSLTSFLSGTIKPANLNYVKLKLLLMLLQ